MPLTHNVLIDQLLVPALFAFFLVAGLAGAALGVAMIVFRDRAFRFFAPMNRWVSARKTLAPLDTLYNIDPTVHKYRRWFGAVFIVGGAFTIFIVSGAFTMIMLVARLDVARVVSLLGGSGSSFVLGWLVESLGWMLMVGSALAIAIGIILGFFPQVLGALEMRANRWVSSRQIAKGADEMHVPFDRWLESYPRAAGWLLAAAALFLTVSSITVLLVHR